MKNFLRLAISIFALLLVNNVAYALETNSATRGEMLYSAHCNVCHTSKIHWRDKKLANDWNSLLVQIRRWQNLLGLGWSEGDIVDVGALFE